MLTALTPVDGDTILPLEDARSHLNLTASDDFHDTAVTSLRDAAIEWVEGYTGTALLERQFEWTVDAFTSSIRLPRGPLVSVDAIDYRDTDGTDAALVEADWYLAGDKVLAAYGTTWPTGDHVRVTFTAGFADAASIPAMLLAAVKVALAALFENRDAPDLTGAMRCADLVRGAVL